MSIMVSGSAYDSFSVASGTDTASGTLVFTLKALPDLILVANAAAAANVLLPKIGSQGCPVGTRVTIRKNDTGGAGVAVTAATAPTSDTIDGNANIGASALPASARNSVTIQAISASAWVTVDSSVVGI